MHILEKYALESASKIDKPFIFETFFPLPFQKYISFSPLNKNKQRYLYWSDVIDIINPYLEKEFVDFHMPPLEFFSNEIFRVFHIARKCYTP